MDPPLWGPNHEGSRSYAAKYASAYRSLLLGRWGEISRAAEDCEGFWGVLGAPLEAQMTGVARFSSTDVSERRPSAQRGGISRKAWAPRPFRRALRGLLGYPGTARKRPEGIRRDPEPVWEHPKLGQKRLEGTLQGIQGAPGSTQGAPRVMGNRLGALRDLALGS